MLRQTPQCIEGAGADVGYGLQEQEEEEQVQEEELYRACTAEQGHTYLGCEEMDKELQKEDTGLNGTRLAVG